MQGCTVRCRADEWSLIDRCARPYQDLVRQTTRAQIGKYLVREQRRGGAASIFQGGTLIYVYYILDVSATCPITMYMLKK